MKACGLDGIGNDFLLMVGQDPRIRFNLLEIFNGFVVHLNPPAIWSCSSLCLIPKVPQPHHWNQTRPIGLLPALSKLWTRLLLKRLTASLPPFSGGQCCGLPGAQIFNACAAVQNIIHKTSEWRVPCIIFKADVEQAFPGTLCSKHCGLSLAAAALMKSSLWQVLLHSELSVPFGDGSFEFQQNRGLRQGAPESPFVFSLIVGVMLRGLAKQWQYKDFPMVLPFVRVLHPIAYMDDLLLLAPNLAQLEDMIQDLQTSLASAGLTINLSKCKVAVNQHTSIHESSVQLCGETVPTVLSGSLMRVLGCMFGWGTEYARTPDAAIAKVTGHYAALADIFRRQSNWDTKLRLLDLVVGGALLWSAPVWRYRKTLVRKLNALHITLAYDWAVILEKHGWSLRFEPAAWPNKP